MEGTIREVGAGASGTGDIAHFGKYRTVVDWSDGTTSVYGHMSEALVKKGQKLIVGQSIGKIGNLGAPAVGNFTMNAHLHFQHYDKMGRLTDAVKMYGW